MIVRGYERLSLVRQCALLGLSRSSVYYRPAEPDAEELAPPEAGRGGLALMALIDRLSLPKTPSGK